MPGSIALAVAYSYVARRARSREESRASGQPFRANRTRDALALVAIAVGFSLLYNNPFVRTRYVALTAIAALIVARFPLRTARAGVIGVVVILLGLFTLYPLANTFRGNQYINAETHIGLDQLAGPISTASSRSRIRSSTSAEHGHTRGADTASAVFFFVRARSGPERRDRAGSSSPKTGTTPSPTSPSRFTPSSISTSATAA